MTGAEGEESTDETLIYERCLVTFIDILGYRELLKIRHSSEVREALDALRGFTRGYGDDDEPPRRLEQSRLYSQAFSE